MPNLTDFAPPSPAIASTNVGAVNGKAVVDHIQETYGVSRSFQVRDLTDEQCLAINAAGGVEGGRERTARVMQQAKKYQGEYVLVNQPGKSSLPSTWAVVPADVAAELAG